MWLPFTNKFSIFQSIFSNVMSPSPGSTPSVHASFPIWDKVVNATNRLIRPGILFAIMTMFWWAVKDPLAFTAFAKAIKELPDMAWYIIFACISFWFGGKSISDIKSKAENGTIVDTDTTITTDTTTTTS